MKPPELIVHHCDWSSQPDVHILCTNTWTTPAWGEETKLQKKLARREIYMGDDERYYTFERKKVTCKECLAKMKPEAA